MAPHTAQAFTARNLELLAIIENTLDALAADTELFSAIDKGYQEIRRCLEGVQGAIDPEDRIGAQLEKSSEACVRIYHDASRRHRLACGDVQLHPDDGVAEAYTSFLQAVRLVHDTIEELREWLATHDAVLEKSTGTVYSNVDDLFDALLSGR